MKKALIVYGSTTGNTEQVAQLIADNLSHEVTLVNVTDVSDAHYQEADLVLLGSSTWGYGDLQDDWETYIDSLSADLLSGKDVAIFGCGDEEGFGDVFCEATEIIKRAAEACGANILRENLKIDGEPSDSTNAIIEYAKQL